MGRHVYHEELVWREGDSHLAQSASVVFTVAFDVGWHSDALYWYVLSFV
jgi:hypothetical protein